MVKSLMLSTVAALSLVASTAEAAPVKRFNYTGTFSSSGTDFYGNRAAFKNTVTATVYQKPTTFLVKYRVKGRPLRVYELMRRGNEGVKVLSGDMLSDDPQLYDCSTKQGYYFVRNGRRARLEIRFNDTCYFDDFEGETQVARSVGTLNFSFRQK